MMIPETENHTYLRKMSGFANPEWLLNSLKRLLCEEKRRIGFLPMQ